MYQTETQTPGVSFLEFEQFQETFPSSAFEPSKSLKQETLRLFATLPEIENVASILQTDESYFAYLESLFSERESLGIINPHKAIIQYEMAKLHINEDTTRIIDPHNPQLLLAYTMKLLKEGKKEIWWSVADKDDITDPQGDTQFSPPLLKHITLHNIGQKFEELQKYLSQHPESLLKVFPQDGKNPSLCSIILVNEPGEKRLNFKIRPSRYTTDDRNEKEEPIEIDIDLNGATPVIIINKAADLRWLQVLNNAREEFAKLDTIDLHGSFYIQPEFMVFRNGSGEHFAFFSDIVWGDKDKKSPPTTPCPKFSPIFKTLGNAKVILKNNSPISDLTTQRQNLKYIFDQFNNPEKVDELWDQLRQIEQGDLPVNEMIIRTLVLALGSNLSLPESANKLILSYKAIDQIFRPRNLDERHGNNRPYMHERLNIREIFELITLISSGELADNLFAQINLLISHSTRHHRTFRSFSKTTN